MEIVWSIVGILGILFLIGNLMVRGKIKRYKQALSDAIEMLDTQEYKQSNSYKERIKIIEENGITASINDFMSKLRIKVMQEYKIAPDFFKNTSVQEAEIQFMMKYALVHGYADEFQRNIEMGL